MNKTIATGSSLASAALFVSMAAVASVSLGQTRTINVAGGTPFSPDLRGQNVPNLGDNTVFGDAALDLTNNSSIRGVAGGLWADTYNWMNQTGEGVGDPGSPGGAALTHLRYARDHNAQQIFTVNVRGTGTGSSTSEFQYTDLSQANLASLAGNWVTYANNIAPNYEQGDALPAAYANIVNSLQWSGQATLRGPGEAATPKVTYWEIGNEPTNGITDQGSYSSNGLTLSTAQYVSNYIAVTNAMTAADPTIKVGPAIASAYDVNNGATLDPYLMALLADKNARIDFISYHPYTSPLFAEYASGGGMPTVSNLEARLKNIRGLQQAEYAAMGSAIQSNNDERYFDWSKFKWVYPNQQRNVNTPLIASEWNPGGFEVSGAMPGRTMAQALGSAETVFTFAQQTNMIAAQYWVWPTSHFGGAHIPQYKTFEALLQHMGDTLLDVLADDSRSIRLYTTKNSTSGEVDIWGLNFSDDTAQTLQLNLTNLPSLPQNMYYQITLMRLANVDGSPTHLMDDTSDSAGDPMSIDWLTSNLTGQLDPSNFSLTLNSAQITLLVFKPMSVPEPAGGLICLAIGGGLMTRRTRRRNTRNQSN